MLDVDIGWFYCDGGKAAEVPRSPVRQSPAAKLWTLLERRTDPTPGCVVTRKSYQVTPTQVPLSE
jgi:hypothetical protein